MEPDALEKLVASFEQNNAAVLARLDEIDERIDGFETRANRPGAPNDRSAAATITAEHEALGAFVRSGSDELLRAAAGLSVGNDVEGGYIVLPKFAEAIRNQLRDAVTMRRLARVINLDTGDAFEEPREQEGDAEAIWVGEKETRPETEFHTLGVDRWPLNEIFASVPVTQKILDLSFLNIGEWVQNRIADKIARAENEAFWTGASQLKPKGILTYPTTAEPDFTRPHAKWQHVVTGHASEVTSDSLRNLYWAVRAPYRRNGVWAMNSETANSIDRLKDGSGAYLLRPSMTAGAADMLLGRPIEIEENMAAVAPGSLPIGFGDWRRGYTITNRPGVKLSRDPISRKPHILFDSYFRVGGGGADFMAVKFLLVAES